MKISEKNIHAHELMNLKVKCIDPHARVVHVGYVYNETKNQLWIKSNKGIKKLLKSSYYFVFDLNGKMIKLHGEKISGEPEERVKRL